ncbi:MAG: hypothetical protein KH047_08470, partial [Eubacterium sp.]|nr:hypothetical protein [Eubacterium sp.]
MKNEKRKGDRQLEKDNKETIAQENVEKETLVQEENKEKENKKTNTKEDKKETEATGMELLDSRFLDKPALAVEQSRRVAVEMANKVKDAINTA